MKYLIYSMVIGGLLFSVASGKEKTFDRNLWKPDANGFSKKMGTKSCQFKQMLDDKKWKEFYDSLPPLFDELNSIQIEAMTNEDLNDLMWCFYLVCGAPLYEIDYTTDEACPYVEDNDISAKRAAASFITTFDVNAISGITGINRKYLCQLNATYFSSILKTLKANYIPDLRKKMITLRQEVFDSSKTRPHALQNRLSKISVFERRNNAVNSLRSSLLEGQFVDMLVRYFPDKAGEVMKYIKMAGYADNEIPALIDRTVGKDSRTAYLYKGNIGREHEKKLKQNRKAKEDDITDDPF